MSSSKVVKIASTAQFDELLQSSKIVVADFFATWCGPCHMIAPVFEKIADALASENAVTFVKIDTDVQKAIASRYQITALPTFVLFRDGTVIDKVQGAEPKRLESLVRKLVTEAGSTAASGASGSGAASGSGSSSSPWRGAALPRGYHDITDQVELTRLELLNVDPDGGAVRTLFTPTKPTGKAKDWVESDTDEQLMLYVPFQSMIKLHTLQITSNPTDDAARPAVIKLYSNSPHNLGFDEAEDTQETQEVELKPSDWNEEGTASVGLRFVKFQNINSLVVFVVSAEDGAEKVRLDRIRVVGESGEKREMGKLEKIGDETGE